MQPKLTKWLRDLAAACDLILDHTAGLSLADYESDRFLQSGVERNFEIIGFRNVLAHGYDVVDHARVWQIVQENLPALRVEVAELIEETEHDESTDPTVP